MNSRVPEKLRSSEMTQSSSGPLKATSISGISHEIIDDTPPRPKATSISGISHEIIDNRNKDTWHQPREFHVKSITPNHNLMLEGTSVDADDRESSSRADEKNSRGQRSGSLVGLRNKGNMCYINSIMQCLLQIQELKKLQMKNNEDEFMDSFNSVFLNMYFGEAISLDPTYLLKEIRKKTEKFANYRQKDAYSFLMFLIRQIEDSCVIKPGDQLFLWKIWRCHLYNCSHTLDFEENIFAFILPITNESLETVFKNKFYDFEQFEEKDLFCFECQQFTSGKISSHVEALPRYLIILINRFDFARNAKNNSSVQYSEMMKIGSIGQYKLFAICNHIGLQVAYGHYTATVYDEERGKWYEYDDYRVRESDISNKEKAYILFYRREK